MNRPRAFLGRVIDRLKAAFTGKPEPTAASKVPAPRKVKVAALSGRLRWLNRVCPDTSRQGTRRARGLPVQRRARVSGVPLRRKVEGVDRYFDQAILDHRGRPMLTGAVISARRAAMRQAAA